MNNQEIAFNRRWELNFRYVCNCLLIDDVDVDGQLEVCAGSRDGMLCVYKFDQSEPWRLTAPSFNTSSGILGGGPFGLITALVVGDLFNSSMPVLISISADGALHACKLSATSPTVHQVGSEQIIQPCFRQLLPSNIKGAYIGDIDGDGRCELIVALTDRVVRTYRFLPCATAAAPAPSTTGTTTASSSGGGITSTTSSTATAPSRTSSTSTHPHAIGNGSGFCCGFLVALNKWESPAQITAFSVCPSSALPDSGVTVMLSQPGDRYLLLKPKLCPENDPSDSLSDISVVYCETSRGTVPKAFDKGQEHRSPHKSFASNGKRKRRLFIAANSTRIDLFHLTSRYVTMVDHNHERRIDYPTQIFSSIPVRIACASSDFGRKSYRDLLISCDWSNNIYACCVDSPTMDSGESPKSGDGGGASNKEEERHHRVTSMVTMKTYGPIMCFSTGYSEHHSPDELYVAVSTSEEKLFVYSVRVAKILKNLD